MDLRDSRDTLGTIARPLQRSAILFSADDTHPFLSKGSEDQDYLVFIGLGQSENIATQKSSPTPPTGASHKHVSTQTDGCDMHGIEQCVLAELVPSISEAVSTRVITEHIRPLFAALRHELVASVTETVLQLSEDLITTTERTARVDHSSDAVGQSQGNHRISKPLSSSSGGWSE